MQWRETLAECPVCQSRVDTLSTQWLYSPVYVIGAEYRYGNVDEVEGYCTESCGGKVVQTLKFESGPGTLTAWERCPRIAPLRVDRIV